MTTTRIDKEEVQIYLDFNGQPERYESSRFAGTTVHWRQIDDIFQRLETIRADLASSDFVNETNSILSERFTSEAISLLNQEIYKNCCSATNTIKYLERGSFSPKGYRTLKGFLDGDEPDQEIYFAHCADLIIAGEIPDLSVISNTLNLQPTHTHRRGERRGPRSPEYAEDMWMFSPDIPEEEPLKRHIDALWLSLQPHKNYLRELKKSLDVSVFLGYRSNCDHAGVDIPYFSLTLFVQLEIPFALSVVIT